MSSENDPIYIATRGSALALAQANMIMAQCRAAFPELRFELKIIKTTGDKLQTASMAQEGHALPKGLFTKELEVALLNNEAGLAVHSLKDLPTDLPAGLKLGAVSKRADVRDVLIYRNRKFAGSNNAAAGRGYDPGLQPRDLPSGATVATSSTRRKAQLLEQNPALKVPDIRGNVATRIRKLMDNADLDATILALAGISRLGFKLSAEGELSGEGIPEGVLASILAPEIMLPCVGQGAIGIEIRENDDLLSSICGKLNDYETHQSVIAERAFLAGMGGGCQSPVAAYGKRIAADVLELTALSFANGPVRRGKETMPLDNAVELGREMAHRLKS
jgi:hydroxymethylbilane synthase